MKTMLRFGLAMVLAVVLGACASTEKSVPTAKRVPGEPDKVFSPFTETPHHVEVSGLKKGTLVECPFTGKRFLVP